MLEVFFLGRISDAQVDLVRDRADIVAIVGERVALEKKGRDFWGRCPFHEEKTPSFHVTPAKQAWYCQGACKRGGNVFTFVQEIERLSFPDAVRFVARRVGVEIEDETPAERARSKRRADQLDAIRRAVDFYKNCLWKKNDATARAAREFLERRGVREETAREFALGVAPQGNALMASARKVPGMLPLLEDVGLVSRGPQGPRDFFHGRVLFPIADESGRWIGFGARRLDERDEPKFLNSRDVKGIFEKRRVLYGLDRARLSRRIRGMDGEASSVLRRPDRFVVVEGYMDVVIAHQAGITNVVAALSTGFTREHASLAKRFVDGVVLLFDGDAAGQTANRRVLEELLELDLEARVASLPAGMDPDDLILKQGPDALAKLVNEGSRDIFEFLVDLAVAKAKGKDAGNGPGRETIAECARLLGKYKDDIKHQLSLKNVAHRLGFPEDILRKEALKARNAQAKNARDPRPRAQVQEEEAVLENAPEQLREILGPHACAGEPFEVGLLEALLARPELAASAAAEIGAEDFTKGPLREVALALFEAAREGNASDDGFGSRILQKLAEKRAASGVVSRLLSRVEEHAGKNYEAELLGAGKLLARRLKARSEALKKEIREAQARGDDVPFALLKEKAELEHSIGSPGGTSWLRRT